MEWYVILDGNEEDLEELSKTFNDPELTIEKTDSGYILKSTNFQSISSSAEIYEKTNDRLENLNAGLLMFFDSGKPIKIQRVISIDDNGNRQGHMQLSCTYEVRSRVTPNLTVKREDGIIETTEKSNPADIIKDLDSIAEKDRRVKDVLELVNHSLNSIGTLYKIMEIIQADNFSPVMRHGRFYKEIRRLKNASGSSEHLGLKDARHADEKKYPISKDPMMTLPEAKSLILTIFREWINDKKT